MESTFEFKYCHYDNFEQMTAEDRDLVTKAQAQCQRAVAPYSNFHVGAAARLASGAVVYGSNVESEVYPAGICAERNLLFAAAVSHPNDAVVALAIASVPSENECYPCGICRQILLDTERRQGSPLRVIMSSGKTATVVESASMLLPFSFSLE
ncbi:MAG: cytidine deaminase [Rikenellaceae bacterium]